MKNIHITIIIFIVSIIFFFIITRKNTQFKECLNPNCAFYINSSGIGGVNSGDYCRNQNYNKGTSNQEICTNWCKICGVSPSETNNNWGNLAESSQSAWSIMNCNQYFTPGTCDLSANARVDCKYTWGNWTECPSADNKMYKFMNVETEPRNGGTECPYYRYQVTDCPPPMPTKGIDELALM